MDKYIVMLGVIETTAVSFAIGILLVITYGAIAIDRALSEMVLQGRKALGIDVPTGCRQRW